jgi:hypothetical protein
MSVHRASQAGDLMFAQGCDSPVGFSLIFVDVSG